MEGGKEGGWVGGREWGWRYCNCVCVCVGMCLLAKLACTIFGRNINSI